MRHCIARPVIFATAIAASCGLPATAEDRDRNFYARVFGGASLLMNTDLSGAVTGPARFDTGQVFGGAFGYDYPAGPFRTELEDAYRTGGGAGPAGAAGDLASTALAVNGYFDLPSVGGQKWTPYIGAGLAYITEIDFDLDRGPAPGEYSDRGVIAYQVMTGLDYRFSERWSVGAELRYFAAGQQTLSGPGGASLRLDYSSIDLLIGTSFRF